MTRESNESVLNGLAIYPSAPAATLTASKSADPPTKTTTIAGWAPLIRLVASRPSMIGISTSMITTSGRRSSDLATASAPLLADPITSTLWLELRARRMTFRIASESSTMRIRIVVRLSCGNLSLVFLSVRISRSYRTAHYVPVTTRCNSITPALQFDRKLRPNNNPRVRPNQVIPEDLYFRVLPRGIGYKTR